MIAPLLTSALSLACLAAADTCPARFLLHPNGDPDACLHVDTITDGAKASIQRCNSSAGQSWTWTTDGQLRLYGTGMNYWCLAAKYHGVDPQPLYNGRQLFITPCYAEATMRWEQNSALQIVLAQPFQGRKVCMDLKDGQIEGGAVQMWHCYDGNPNQRWTVDDW